MRPSRKRPFLEVRTATDTEQGLKRFKGGAAYGKSAPKYKGEKHVYMKVPGGIARANYAGPGTNVRERIKRGDAPINAVDAISKAHDLRYMIATDYDAVRAADNKMVAALKSLPSGADSKLNIFAAKKAMQSKLKLEDSGLAKRGKIAQHGVNVGPEDMNMYKKELQPLAQEGFGKKRKRPAKGSQEAKDQMAALRAMRGKGLKMAGDGTDGGPTIDFYARKMLSKALLIGAQALREANDDAGCSLLEGAGLAIAGNGLNMAGDGLSMGGDGLSMAGDGLSMAGNGMYGGKWWKKAWAKIKRGASNLYHKVLANPQGAMDLVKKHAPAVIAGAKQFFGKGPHSKALAKATKLLGFGEALQEGMCDCVSKHMLKKGSGQGEPPSEGKHAQEAPDTSAVLPETVKLVGKPVAPGFDIASELETIVANPKLLTDKQYLSSLAGRFTAVQIRKLSAMLKPLGINVVLALPKKKRTAKR